MILEGDLAVELVDDRHAQRNPIGPLEEQRTSSQNERPCVDVRSGCESNGSEASIADDEVRDVVADENDAVRTSALEQVTVRALPRS